MPDQIDYFLDTFEFLCKISSDPHWQRARDIARRWQKLAHSESVDTDEVVDLATLLATEEWNGPFSLWRRMSVEFMDWARSHRGEDRGADPEAAYSRTPANHTASSVNDIIDHSIWYYFPSPENRAVESKRGLYVALRWKRLVESEKITQLDINGLLGALDERGIGASRGPGDQWRYLENQIQIWAQKHGFAVSGSGADSGAPASAGGPPDSRRQADQPM